LKSTSSKLNYIRLAGKLGEVPSSSLLEFDETVPIVFTSSYSL